MLHFIVVVVVLLFYVHGNESMWPDRVSNPGPLTYESGALPIALRGPVAFYIHLNYTFFFCRYWQMNPGKARNSKGTPKDVWDQSVYDASEEYKTRMVY